MDGERLLSRLEREGLLEATEDDDELRLTDGFLSSIAEYEAAWHQLTDEEVLDELVDATGEESLASVSRGDDERDRGFVYIYAALHERLPDLDASEKVQLSTLFDSVRGESAPNEGAPEAFLPVHGDHLPTLLRSYRGAIVYVWREDCDPCDLMRESFDGIFDEPPDDLGLFAVYGPDAARTLHEEYDVVGAPTTLFVLDGEVDARLSGAHYDSVIETEIETLREYL